jgi:hypothetical protein
MPTSEATPEPSEPSTIPESSTEPNITLEEGITPELGPESSSTEQTKDVAKYDIKGDVTTANIIDGKRTRKQQAYTAAIEHLDKLSSFHTIIAAASHYITARFHRSELPPAPRSWKELLGHKHFQGFKAAAYKEYTDLQRRGTFVKVSKQEPTEKGELVIPTMWVFTYKFDKDGYLTKYKARLVVRGDLQHSKHSDTYAATLAAKIFRALMAIAAYFDLEIAQYDAVNAFTNSYIDELVYIEYPEGFKELNHYLKLLRALYGLTRSPLLWFKELSSKLIKLGLKQVPEAQCLFINKHLMVFFYVDDICVLYHRDSKEEYELFRSKLLEEYEIRELGDLKWFLGIRIIRDRSQSKLWLCQDSYIDKMVSDYKLENRPTPKIPLQTDELLPYERKATSHAIHAYQQRVGSLTYIATTTRPDIARATQKLAEFLTNPSPDHISIAEDTISYLKGTRTLAIEYSNTNPSGPLFRSSSDAAFADDSSTRKSTEGALFQLFGGPIDWRSIKQKTVTTSTTEAELLALSHLCKDLLWWQRLFKGLELDLKEDYTAFCDNLQTVRLMLQDSPKLVTKLKHVDIHQHWLRQEVNNKTINIDWISTSIMPADGLTKALPLQKYKTFVSQLNLVDIKTLLRN